MILDERGEFGDDSTLVGTSGSTYVLGDVIDLGENPTTRNLGAGEPLYLVIEIGGTGVDSAGDAATLVFSIKSDSTADLATSPTTHYASAALAEATMVANYRVVAVALPEGDYERYLGVTYLPGTEDTTAGTANAYLTKDVAKLGIYPDGI